MDAIMEKIIMEKIIMEKIIMEKIIMEKIIMEKIIMEKIKVPVRMSENLRERLKAEAKHSVRSLNGEIIHRLLQSLKQTDQPRSRGGGVGVTITCDWPAVGNAALIMMATPMS